MKKTVLIILGLIAVFLIGRYMTRPKLSHFKASEFGLWWPLMNADQLRKLDAFRKAWGYPVEISTANGSLGRHGGEESNSQHNVDKWGEVHASDVFPKVPDGKGGFRYMQTVDERRRAYDIALSVGFSGIGLYTDTKPGNLLHVDNREAERVALWSRVNGDYLGINEVLS